MAVLLNEDRFVPALEQMACPLMTFIKKLCIDPIQLSHTQGEVAIRRFDQEVIVVVHQAVSMTEPVIPLIDVLERVQEVDAVLVALEDGLSFVAPGGNVVDCTGVFYAEGAGHEGNLANNKENVKLKDLTL